MRRYWLAGALAADTVSVPVALIAGPGAGQAQAAQVTTPVRVLRHQGPVTWNMVAAALARRLVGDRYIYGGTSTAGFDCSGLTQFVYGHAGHGKHIARTAQEQYLQFRRISHASARPGDLVFFHETTSPSSYVYHVGVYEGGEDMVAAATYSQGVVLQSFAWGGGTVTFGTITH
jgi:cell wall-associated NlpC family hydrolase